MKRLFVREEKPAERMPVRIGVTGTGHRTGVSMIASSLALACAEKGFRVSYLECWDGNRLGSSLYEGAGFDRRMPDGSFPDAFRLLKEKRSMPEREALVDGVCWKVHTPQGLEDGQELTDSERAWLIAGDRSEVQILDIDSLPGSRWREYLETCDRIVAVLDPLPSRVATEREQIQFLKRLEIARGSGGGYRGNVSSGGGKMPAGTGRAFTWVVNFMNPGVGRKMVRSWLKSTDILWMDAFSPQISYELEYYCRFPYENGLIKEQMAEVIENMGFSGL